MIIISVLALLGSLAANTAGEEIELHGQRWSVSIDPETLRVTGTPTGEAQFVVSSPQPRVAGIADLRHDDRQASWRLRDERISVAMRLEDDALVVHFAADQPGSFTWPIAGPDPAWLGVTMRLLRGSFRVAEEETLRCAQGDGLESSIFGLFN